MRAYLVRHGESQDDVEDCYGGIADFPLTDLGRETAKQLAAKLSGKGILRIYTSPYQRAAETAAIIRDHLGCEVRTIHGLRERNSYGVLSGVNIQRAKDIFAHVIVGIHGKPGDYYSSELLTGAEPIQEFDARVLNAIGEITQDASGLGVICIVTHGNVTRSVYKNVLKIPAKVGLDLLALTEIEWIDGNARLVRNEGVTI